MPQPAERSLNVPKFMALQAARQLIKGASRNVSLGAVYPLGWAVLAWLIPFLGVEALRGPVEWIFFVPFGGALILGLLGSVALSMIACLRGTKENDGHGR